MENFSHGKSAILPWGKCVKEATPIIINQAKAQLFTSKLLSSMLLISTAAVCTVFLLL